MSNIRKKDLCDRVAKRLEDKSTEEVKLVVDSLFEEILKILSEDLRIEIRGFGTFKVKRRKARIGRNPRTGETVLISAHKAPVFKFFKDAQGIF